MIPESYGIERVNVSALTAFSGNPRTHSDTQIDQIAASIREFGWTKPILVDAIPTMAVTGVGKDMVRDARYFGEGAYLPGNELERADELFHNGGEAF